MDDEVFRALADPRRRQLLDSLRDRDGQTLSELEASLPALGRFGVMRHLRILEAAHLITTQKQGRHKHHFLNAVPIRLLHDRWIANYEVPVVRTLTGIKQRLEASDMSTTKRYEIYIATTPERLWAAITDPELTRTWWYGALSKSDWQPGSAWRSESPDGEVYLDGEIVEADPPHRLVQTFHVVHRAEAAANAPSRLTWEIEQTGESCRLTLIHDELAEATADYVTGGWEYLLSALKTVLETGRPLVVG
jgi:uncharacterized protein YndB with AHSA1/START domain